MNELEQLFGSKPRVKIMRLFLFNPETPFDYGDVAKRTKTARNLVSKEVKLLQKAGLLRSKKFVKVIEKKLKTKTKEIKKKSSGYVLNEKFKHLLPLRNLLTKSEPMNRKNIEEKFKKAGSIKLLLVSGVFLGERGTLVDILIVGDHLDLKNIENAVNVLESEIGKELRYSVFETEDFEYRTNIYDQLVHNILDDVNEKLINKLDI